MNSMSQQSRENENENIDEVDDWSQDCLEYLFDKKIWLPGFVRSECPILDLFSQILARTKIFNSYTTLTADH